MTYEILEIDIETHYAGDYRVEYDGKYLTLFGKDNRYDMEGMFNAPKGSFEEMVLVPVVIEKRKLIPLLVDVDEETNKIKVLVKYYE